MDELHGICIIIILSQFYKYYFIMVKWLIKNEWDIWFKVYQVTENTLRHRKCHILKLFIGPAI